MDQIPTVCALCGILLLSNRMTRVLAIIVALIGLLWILLLSHVDNLLVMLTTGRSLVCQQQQQQQHAFMKSAHEGRKRQRQSVVVDESDHPHEYFSQQEHQQQQIDNSTADQNNTSLTHQQQHYTGIDVHFSVWSGGNQSLVLQKTKQQQNYTKKR